MISLQSTTSRHLLKIGEVAKRLGWTRRQAHWLVDTQLSEHVVRTAGGHRLLPQDVLDAYTSNETPAAVSPDPSCSRPQVILCARVSSEGQSKRRGKSEQSDLDRQVQMLHDYITNRWQDAEVTEDIRVASGCNFSKLESLIDLILSGKYQYLVAKDFTRVMRIGFEVIEILCRKMNIEIIYVCDTVEDDPDDTREMVSQLISVMTLFTARASGQRTIHTQRRVLNEDQLRRVWVLRCQGYSINTITQMMKDEECSTASGTVSKVSKKIIENQLRLNRKMLERLYPPESIKSHFETWVEAAMVPSATQWISYQDMLQRYQSYCRKNNVNGSYNGNKLVRMLRQSGYVVQRRGTKGRSHVRACYAGV